MKDCKHDKITLDDFRWNYGDTYFACPHCGKELQIRDLIKLGYELVKVSDERKE